HALQVEPLKQREGLQQHRPLAPEPGLEDLESAVTRLEDSPGRRLDAAPVSREIGRGHEAARLLDRERNLLTDVTAIEAVARGIDRDLSALRRVLPLGRDERAQGVGQVRLTEEAADGGN